MEMKQYFKRKPGDRYDGWRVKDVDPLYSLTPYLQRTRLDSECLFEETIPLEPLEKFIHEHREDMPGLSIMHIVIAAIVRVLSQRPVLNRFIVYNKLYAHNSIRIALAIKRTMDDAGAETTIMPEFDPFSALPEIQKKIAETVEENKKLDTVNDSDAASEFIGKMPPFITRPFVNLMRRLDYIGLLPKFFYSASPYHSSAFITNVGSLGIAPVYHHLYEFGTCSFFVAMGKKCREYYTDRDGVVKERRTIGMKYVIDERVSDGHYYAVSMRYFKKLLANPHVLMSPPDKVVLDDGLRRPVLNNPNKTK